MGRGILRRATKEAWPCDITVYSRDETKQALCKQAYPHVRYLLGDVRDKDRLEAAFAGHDVVIHAAAVKYIPEAEFNVSECIDVNVQGTRNVLSAAKHTGVQKVICLSTDKAVQPVNVYGMTKALNERLIAEQSMSGCSMTAVRYGNVVGSTGSVIPMFVRQLKEQGYITLTDPEMTRYWLSVNQAIDLILKAIVTEPRVVLISSLHAMTMGHLAETIAKGHSIKVIGPRPGEKRHEYLLHTQESVRAEKRQDDMYVLYPPGTEPKNTEPFELTSASPREWLDKDALLSYIEEAVSV